MSETIVSDLQDTLEQVKAYFPPNPFKHGLVTLWTNKDTGELKKTAETLEGKPVDDDLLTWHLGEKARGKTKAGYIIGYLPALSENETTAGVIDLDGKDYPQPGALEDAKHTLSRTLDTLEVAYCWERSIRGNGWHGWVFSSAPIPISAMRDALRSCVARAGLGASTEVYPMGEDARGRWVVTPYSGALQDERGLGRTFLETWDEQPIPVFELSEYITRTPLKTLLELSQTAHSASQAPSSTLDALDLHPDALPLLLEVLKQKAPSSRHDTAPAFLNLGRRCGQLEAMTQALKDVYSLWVTDGSRTEQQWGEEIERWAEHIRIKGAGGRGIPYLKAQGYTLPNLPRLERTAAHHAGSSSRPAVDLPFDHFDTAQALFDALQSTNDPPHLFCNDDGLCRLEKGRLGRMVRVLGAKELKGHIGRRFALTKTHFDDKGEAHVKDHNLSDKEALFMLGLELDTYRPFPFLGGILRTPVYNASGVLETREGYSKALEMFLDLGGRAVPDVPEKPTPQEVSEARALLLEELLCDFPFTDDASRAHAVALGLQPLARALIGGPTPLYGIEAPVRGTGKTLLATLMGYIVTGQEVGVIAAPTGGSKDSDEEWRKTIVAELGHSPTVVLFDNANEIDSKTLASSITAMTVKARILGYSKMFTARNVFTWVFTANNPQLSSEIARRTVTIRLESPFEEPELREGFKHPNLTQWVRENRERLLWALLVLIQNWLSLGRPLCGKTLGSFEDWVAVMGGILETADIPGFLDNIKTASRMTTNDAAQWRDFTAAWWEHFSDSPLTSSALLELAHTGDYLGHILNAKGKDGKERTGRSLQTSFGLELKRRAETVGGGRIIGRFKLTYGGTDSHTGVALYRLLELSEARESAGGAQGTARYGKPPNIPSDTASSVAVPLNQGTAEVQQRYGKVNPDLSSPSDPALEVQQRYGIGTATGTASLEPVLNGVSRDMPYLAVPKTPQDENKNSDLAKDDDAGYL